jgi:hypothetical protein
VGKLDWRKSSRCESSGCIEVAFTEQGVAVRDSKVDDGPVLTFSTDAWRAFLDDLRAGRLEAN